MKIHEYQAKRLFNGYNIPVEQHILCCNVDESLLAYAKLKMENVMIKAQVLTGGRGKAGGVKLAKSKNDVLMSAGSIFQMKIKDFPVTKVLVSEAVDIESEFYVSFSIDRNTKSVILMLSSEGGVDIEEVARNTPDKIERFIIDPFIGIPDYLGRKFAFCLFDNMALISQMVRILQNLYRLFIEKDTSLAEINPLVLTKEGKLLAIDAKMTFDDNALYRQPDILPLAEPTIQEQKEIQAKAKGFSYVQLDGEIGCMVNGAGLAMATMDLIKLYGGNPANFLDIGGSSNPEKVIEAMKLLLQDKQVKVVLINIFGGITRCDDVASGLLKAFEQIHTNIPIIVRLAGTNEVEGRALLLNTNFLVAESMSEATHMAVKHSLEAI